GQSILSPHLWTLLRRAAAEVIGLKDEPVGYWPKVARLKNGRFGSYEYLAIVAASPETNACRSNVGRLASARISPLHGSSATIAPFLSPSALSAARCSFGSSDKTTSRPGTGAGSASVSTGRSSDSTMPSRNPYAPPRSPSRVAASPASSLPLRPPACTPRAVC